MCDTFGSRLDVAKQSGVTKGPGFSSFHHSNSFGTNNFDSSKNISKNFNKPLGLGLSSGEHAR